MEWSLSRLSLFSCKNKGGHGHADPVRLRRRRPTGDDDPPRRHNRLHSLPRLRGEPTAQWFNDPAHRQLYYPPQSIEQPDFVALPSPFRCLRIPLTVLYLARNIRSRALAADSPPEHNRRSPGPPGVRPSPRGAGRVAVEHPRAVYSWILSTAYWKDSRSSVTSISSTSCSSR